MTAESPGWRPFQFTRDLAMVGKDGRSLSRAVASGEAVKVRRGVFVGGGGWASVNDRDHYLLRMRAVAATRASLPIFSHYSAAVIWGLPIIGQWPQAVHLLAAGRGGLHSKNGVTIHHDRLVDADIVEIDGMLVTSLARTLVDLARSTSFLSAVASLDAGTKPELELLNRTLRPGAEREVLLERVMSLGASRGARSARLAIEFSDNRSASPGESLSRGQIYLCGFPAPELQVHFVSPEGAEDIVDFRWLQKQGVRTLRLIGEFDGEVKYTRTEFLKGRTAAEVVVAEKVREDRLRANTNHSFVRWVWGTALRKEELRAVLLRAGLRPR
ncbi:hypothetical protein [Leifsonia sp. A12D58]|uniref:hypothetical protein n=1 Tax=Leifsonia sp. A12D58 TaxID=3397674 RepID=UPI0039E13FBB